VSHVQADILREWGKDVRLIVRSTDPLNVETPLNVLEGAITPLPVFFVRNNDTIPQIDRDSWTLTIDGLVERSLTITYADLRRLPAVSYVTVLQCSGNGRARFTAQGPEPEGIQWHNGAVGNAEWVGVSVRTLFEQAGVSHTAIQAECIGGDAARTTRGVEVTKLMDDAILAYAINGELLPVIHGGPVRLIVPGWGGINSIKWITGMRLIDHESSSDYNQQKYVIVDEQGHQLGKVREITVNSVISNIRPDQRLTAGATVVRGYAWAPNGIERVEISADGGDAWHAARLMADLGPRSWRQWEWSWEATPGTHVLASRAMDRAGNVQPETVAYNQQGYLMNAIDKVRVTIV
jgi:sulfite oxidase